MIGIGITLALAGVLGGDAGAGLGPGNGEVATPTVTSPTNGSSAISLTPTITSSAFSSEPADVHFSSDWQIASDAGFTSIVQQSLDDTTNKTSWTPAALAGNTVFYVRVRHTGAAWGDSDWSAGVSFTTMDAATSAYIAAMSVQPDASRRSALDTFIKGLKTEGIWAELRGAGILRAHDSQAALLWLTDPSRSCTAVGSPVFTADRGYVGVPSTGYLNTGWDAINDAGGVFVQNDACLGCYLTPGVGTDTSSSTAVAMGAGTASNRILLTPFSGANSSQGQVNQTGATTFTSGVSTRTGLSAVQRTAAGAVQFYRNGAAAGTGTTASGGMPTQDLFLLAWNSSGTPTSGINNQMGFWFIGGALSAGQHTALDNLWDAYVAATP